MYRPDFRFNHTPTFFADSSYLTLNFSLPSPFKLCLNRELISTRYSINRK
jgi:hypothetical protein